jgi:hypothetical protein
MRLRQLPLAFLVFAKRVPAAFAQSLSLAGLLLLTSLGRVEAATMEARSQPGGHTLIWISGALEPGDGLKFRELTSEVSRATVFLASPPSALRHRCAIQRTLCIGLWSGVASGSEAFHRAVRANWVPRCIQD